MKIKSIKISNILSFERKESIDDCQEITFDDGLNVLIGPNGAGKSNFLEIINKLFHQILTPPCVLNESLVKSFKKSGQGNLRDVLGKPNASHQLPVNHNFPTHPRQIKIKIKLDENDKDNLIFINKNVDRINLLSQKYSNNHPNFPTNIQEDEFTNFNEIELLFEGQPNAAQLTINTRLEGIGTFIFLYLQNFYFLQQLIQLANKEENETWPTLKNSFAMMSGYRNYNNIDLNFGVGGDMNQTIQNLKADIANETTLSSSNNEPKVFNFVKSKIGYSYHQLRYKIGNSDEYDPIEKFSDDTFHIINEMLQEILSLKLYVWNPDPDSLNYSFNFKDSKTDQPVNITEFSSGQKGMLHFIFSILGYELKNGLMIIDEPELHLHPQIQQDYLNIIFRTISKMNLQFILATHSPVFINSQTIKGAKRFYKENDFTKVIISENTPKHHNLIKYLDYTKATNIMFSDHVVLVEGESDAYVYKFYYENYKKRNKIKNDLNFIHIVGKDAYKEWKKFFEDWKIKYFFIRDLDDFGGGEQEIKQKYNENIFILKNGKLEDYIGKEKSEKFANAVDFCENRYDTWYHNNDNISKIQELDGIFSNIFSKL